MEETEKVTTKGKRTLKMDRKYKKETNRNRKD
jgi:hypothetical protein